jgi:hypothetical protein
MGPAPDFFRRRQADLDGIEIGDRVLHFERARTKQGVPPLPALKGSSQLSVAIASLLSFAGAESLGPRETFLQNLRMASAVSISALLATDH